MSEKAPATGERITFALREGVTKTQILEDVAVARGYQDKIEGEEAVHATTYGQISKTGVSPEQVLADAGIETARVLRVWNAQFAKSDDEATITYVPMLPNPETKAQFAQRIIAAAFDKSIREVAEEAERVREAERTKDGTGSQVT